MGGIQHHGKGLTQGLQFADDPFFRLFIGRPGEFPDAAVGGDHHADGGVFLNHLSGADFRGLFEGDIVFEPGSAHHAGGIVFLRQPPGAVDQVANAVHQPHPNARLVF